MPIRLLHPLLAGFLFVLVAGSVRADDAWILSGQSNMQKIGGPAREAIGRVVASHDREYEPIYVAAPGKPIEAWLEPDHKDHELWTKIVEAVTRAKEAGHRFRGFVWYQGESNVKGEPHRYQSKLAELVTRVRKLTGEPELPVIVVQIGAATSYDGTGWAVGVVREAQRRFVAEDGHAALVTAIDAEIGDYTVHLSKQGAEQVAERIAAAADRLAYDNEGAHWGPAFRRARFTDTARRNVIVDFDDVSGELKLENGGLAGFAVATNATWRQIVESFEKQEANDLVEADFVHPVAGRVLDGQRLLLAFDEPLPAGATLSHAARRNAQYGPSRRWRIEFGGLSDEAGHVPAFVLTPIEPAGDVVEVPALERPAGVRTDWEQIAVNCIGRFPKAVTAPSVEAGNAKGDWRQAYWNPASAGTVPNLFDRDGRVTPIHFHTGVWYMSPYFRELRDGDDALMASWCKNATHGFSGLEPGRSYDLAVYLLQGPPNRASDPAPESRPVRVNVLHLPANRKTRDANVVATGTVDVPASGRFESFVAVRGGEEGHRAGNLLLLPGVRADADGRLDLTVQVEVRKGDKLKWDDATLAGVQIRRSAE